MHKRRRWAGRMKSMRRSTIREILKLTKQPGMISFAGGLPAPELFPLKAFSEAMEKTLQQDGAAALQYDVTEGYGPLKEFLCGWLSKQGVACNPENMMFTSGSQQALDLIGRVFFDPGDRILVENPTYLGAIQAFNAYEVEYLSAPMDEHGMIPDVASRLAKKRRPKIGYFVPTFQNPSGITMTLERRLALLKLAREQHFPIVEDDPYSYLRFRGERVPSLHQLAKGKNVIYVSTFSKLLSPGIRLGFVVAEPDIITSLVLAKQAADLQPNSLIQRAVYHYCEAGHLDLHIPTITEAYRVRANQMMTAIREFFPPGIRCVEPEGGMFIWCTLPAKISAMRLFKEAVKHNVAYVAGTVFHPHGDGRNTLRLNFTNSTAEQIRTGIQRLGDVFREALV
jgi:2-aminoadipate transaminase